MSDGNNTNSDLISLSDAASLAGYHPDYLGHLARIGKLEAKKIGRNWITTKSALERLFASNTKFESVKVSISKDNGQKNILTKLLPEVYVKEQKGKLLALKKEIILQVARKIASEKAARIAADQVQQILSKKITASEKFDLNLHGNPTSHISGFTGKKQEKDLLGFESNFRKKINSEINSQLEIKVNAKFADLNRLIENLNQAGNPPLKKRNSFKNALIDLIFSRRFAYSAFVLLLVFAGYFYLQFNPVLTNGKNNSVHKVVSSAGTASVSQLNIGNNIVISSGTVAMTDKLTLDFNSTNLNSNSSKKITVNTPIAAAQEQDKINQQMPLQKAVAVLADSNSATSAVLNTTDPLSNAAAGTMLYINTVSVYSAGNIDSGIPKAN